MTVEGDWGGRAGGGPVETREDLVRALITLPVLADPVEQIRALDRLIPVVSGVLADERARIIAALTDKTRPGRMTQAQLAARLKIHPNKVTAALRRLAPSADGSGGVELEPGQA